MEIFKYWARGTVQVTDARGKGFSVGCWRGSNVDVTDARESAGKAAAEIARMVLDTD